MQIIELPLNVFLHSFCWAPLKEILFCLQSHWNDLTLVPFWSLLCILLLTCIPRLLNRMCLLHFLLSLQNWGGFTALLLIKVNISLAFLMPGEQVACFRENWGCKKCFNCKIWKKKKEKIKTQNKLQSRDRCIHMKSRKSSFNNETSPPLTPFCVGPDKHRLFIFT